jgi:hypothetical protein
MAMIVMRSHCRMSELQDMLQLRCQHIVVCIQDIFAQILAFCGPNVEIRKLAKCTTPDLNLKGERAGLEITSADSSHACTEIALLGSVQI